jgi:hypothetical protein
MAKHDSSVYKTFAAYCLVSTVARSTDRIIFSCTVSPADLITWKVPVRGVALLVLIFLITFYLQALQIHPANGVKLLEA